MAKISFLCCLPFLASPSIAIGELSGCASKSVLSAFLCLSSSKGDSLPSSSAHKTSQKHLILRSKNFKIIKNCYYQAKNAGNPDGLASILVQIRAIFVS